MYSDKEKSWVVRLILGQVWNGRVRSEYCGNCESMAKLVVGNNDNSNLLLYGCNTKRCKHVLMRVDFGSTILQDFVRIEPNAFFQTVKDSTPIVQIG